MEIYHTEKQADYDACMRKKENNSTNAMTETIIAYYKNKRKTENVDTALNMTISNFWLNTKLLKSLSKYIQENEK